MNDLPSEVLLCVFKFALAYHDRDEFPFTLNRYGPPKVDTSSLLLLTHVCREWRSIILDYSRFWRYVDGAGRDQLDAFTCRSRTLPLSLVLNSDMDDLGVLSVNEGRIRRLDLTILPPHTAAKAVPLLCFDPSSLECLTITYGDSKVYTKIPRPTTSLFAQESIPLKALAMYNTPTWLLANRFPQLTHLYLRMSGTYAHTNLVSISTLLLSTPVLENLFINQLPTFADPPVHLVQVELRNLRFATISDGDYGTVISLISSWIVPPDARICLDHLWVFDDNDLPLPPRLAIMEGVTTLQIATDDDVIHLIAEGTTCGFWLQTRNGSAQTGWTTWMKDLHRFLPLHDITALRVYVGENFGALQNLLRQVPRVAQLNVRLERAYEAESAEFTSSVARSLYRFLSDPGVCPSLRSLGIDIQDDNRTFMDIENIQSESPVDLHLEDLVRMVAERERGGSPLLQFALQPFARAYGYASLSMFDQLSSLSETLRQELPNIEVNLPYPGRPLSAFKRQRALWRYDRADVYWSYPDFMEPSCNLPWVLE